MNESLWPRGEIFLLANEEKSGTEISLWSNEWMIYWFELMIVYNDGYYVNWKCHGDLILANSADFKFRETEIVEMFDFTEDSLVDSWLRTADLRQPVLPKSSELLEETSETAEKGFLSHFIEWLFLSFDDSLHSPFLRVHTPASNFETICRVFSVLKQWRKLSEALIAKSIIAVLTFLKKTPENSDKKIFSINRQRRHFSVDSQLTLNVSKHFELGRKNSATCHLGFLEFSPKQAEFISTVTK